MTINRPEVRNALNWETWQEIGRLAKKVINNGLATDFATGLALEKSSQAFLFGTEDRVEGITAFLEKRTPNFQGK